MFTLDADQELSVRYASIL